MSEVKLYNLVNLRFLSYLKKTDRRLHFETNLQSSHKNTANMTKSYKDNTAWATSQTAEAIRRYFPLTNAINPQTVARAFNPLNLIDYILLQSIVLTLQRLRLVSKIPPSVWLYKNEPHHFNIAVFLWWNINFSQKWCCWQMFPSSMCRALLVQGHKPPGWGSCKCTFSQSALFIGCPELMRRLCCSLFR